MEEEQLNPVTHCPSCGRPTGRIVLDPLTRDERVECATGYSPCTAEQVEAALAGRRPAPQPGLEMPT